MIDFFLRKLSFCCVILFIFSSCSNEKKLIYFQKSNKHSDTIMVSKPYVPKIQQGDILSIPINSLSAEASSFFNPYSGGAIAGSSQATGYLVDSAGIIQMPIIGNLKVSGLTTSQVRDSVKLRLLPYLKEPTVQVRFSNFKISILGEINKPDVYNVPNEMITLPELISMAGDMTIFARRDSVEVARNINGQKVFGYVNLNNREVFSSPYYYLHANDIVYIKPSKVKTQQTDRSFQFISLGLSVVSFLFILFKIH